MKTKRNNKVRKNKTRKKHNKLKHYIFGYGSLINPNSIKHTGGASIGKLTPVVLKKSAGFTIEWFCHSLQFKERVFVTLKKNKNRSQNVYGVIAPIQGNFKEFDKREKGYKRIDIYYDPNKKCCFKSLYGYKMPDHKCFIHFYINEKKTKKPNKDCPISQNYIDVIVLGALKFNHDFAKKIIKSIHYWKGINGLVHWVNDRKYRKKRKYMRNVSNYKLKKVDSFIKKIIPRYFNKRTECFCLNSEGISKNNLLKIVK